MSLLVKFFLFLLALSFSGLFAFLETAFTALRLFKLKELALSVSKYRTLFESWEKNPQRILITILIANNFAHVLTSVLISSLMERVLGPWGLAIGVGLATVVILIFGEIIPKSFAKSHHERLFGSFLWLVNLLYHVEYPLVTVLLKIADAVFLPMGSTHVLEKHDVSEKEIEFLIDYSDEKGIMETEKTEMLQNIFGLGQTTVKEVMIPRNHIVAIEAHNSIDAAIDTCWQSRYSRIPVYEGNPDNIVGLVHQKDLFEVVCKKTKKSLRELMRPVLFIPETQRINQLLSEFLKKRMHMAIVIDEYGIVAGLVTLEDLIEEIVGEITDEHEHVSELIIPLENGGWLIEGSTGLEAVEELLGITMRTQDSVTLAGFLVEQFQHLPKKGERFLYEGYWFQVQQANIRRILQVLVFEDKETPNEATTPSE